MTHLKKYWIAYLVALIIIIIFIWNFNAIAAWWKAPKTGTACITSDQKDGLISPTKQCVPLVASRTMNPAGTGTVARWNCYGAGFAYHSSVGCKSDEVGVYIN